MASPIDITRLQPPGVTEKYLTRMLENLRGYWNSDGGLDRPRSKSRGVPCAKRHVRKKSTLSGSDSLTAAVPPAGWYIHRPVLGKDI